MLDLITTLFEVAGLLLIAAAVFAAIAPYSLAGALAGAGGTLLLESALIVARMPKPKRDGETVA